MKTLHTPGPWKINDADPKKLFVYNEKFGAVCEIPHGSKQLEEHTSNARLIASAPEMKELLEENLQALKNLTGRECYNSGHDECQCTACKTKRLITKIGGGES